MTDAEQGFLGSRHEPEPGAVENTPASQTLADLELELFGPNPVRLHGRIERGSGSPYQALLPEQRAHYDAVEKLVEAEDALVKAEEHAAAAALKVEEQKARIAEAAELADKRLQERANAGL
jgi:hypothetical protein